MVDQRPEVKSEEAGGDADDDVRKQRLEPRGRIADAQPGGPAAQEHGGGHGAGVQEVDQVQRPPRLLPLLQLPACPPEPRSLTFEQFVFEQLVNLCMETKWVFPGCVAA